MKHTRPHRSRPQDPRTRLYRRPYNGDLAWFPENPIPGERYHCTVMSPARFELHTDEPLYFNPRDWFPCTARPTDR